MSHKFEKIIGNLRENVILKNVLLAFGQDTYAKIVSLLTKNPDMTDDNIFQELAKDEKKSAESFNKYKLTGVANLMKSVVRIEPTMRILDFGSADGAAVNYLAETYRIPYVDAADIVDRVMCDRVRFTKVDVGKKLPYMNDEFDVVFCMMTLHHIRDVEETIKELHRISRRWLVIHEHDATLEYRDILDIVHGMYMFVKNDNDYEKTDKFANFQAWYRSRYEWDDLLKKYFSRLWTHTTANPQNNYFALYRKK